VNAFNKIDKRKLKERKEEIIREFIRLDYSVEEIECDLGEAA